MKATPQQINDLEQRLNTIHRHLHALGLSAADLESIARNLHGLARAINEFEHELQAQREPQPDGERAAQAAREVVYQQRPNEVKVIR